MAKRSLLQAYLRNLWRGKILIQAEAFQSHECTEIGASRFRILPRLVFRPAVERRLSPPFGIALPPVRVARRAALVVSRDLGRKIAVAVAIRDQGCVERKARRYLARLRRPSHTEA